MISQVYNSNCEHHLYEWSEKFFGLAVPDPPYFSGPERGTFYGTRTSAINVTRPKYDKLQNWQVPSDNYFMQLFRISDNQIIWGGNYYPQLGNVHPTPRGEELQAWIDEHPRGWIVWDKCQTNPSFNDYELAWTSFDRPTVVFTFMWSGMLQGLSMEQGHIMQGNKRLNQKRIHQTQKPTQIYQWQYINYADRSKPIIDTHMGSQSSRIVAHKMGFEYYGYEIDKTAFDNGNKRFKELTHLPLFENI